MLLLIPLALEVKPANLQRPNISLNLDLRAVKMKIIFATKHGAMYVNETC